MLAWLSVHACARCTYHRALCGCERMFVYAHSIESIIHLVYMQNMYLCIVSVWDSVHKCVYMCLGHVYMHAVWVHVSRGDVFECMCPGLLYIFKYLWSVCMWAECIYVMGICKCMLYICLWIMHRHYVRCLSIWSVCGCHRACAFIKPPNTCSLVVKSTGFTDKLLRIELWLCHVLSVWHWANGTSGCLSFPICKMVIVISSASQSCHWALDEWILAVVGRIMVISQISTPQICDYLTLRGKRDLEGRIMLRIFTWEDHPGFLKHAQCHHKGFYKREAGIAVKENVRAEGKIRVRWPWAKECGWHLETGKDKETNSPLESPEET